MKVIMCVAAVAAVLISSVATAETRLAFEPVTAAGANVRYFKGVATLDREDMGAAVQVTPLGLDHGRLSFAVSVVNLGQTAENFGIENISASVGTQVVPILSRERLDSMARNRAHWAQFAVAMAAGLGAAAAASTRDTYRATTYTSHGTYNSFISAPSIGGQVAAATMSNDGAFAVAGIQARLDATRNALANEIVQTTTIMPKDSYAGRFVIEKFKGDLPQDVHLVMALGGSRYPFDFRVSKQK